MGPVSYLEGQKENVPESPPQGIRTRTYGGICVNWPFARDFPPPLAWFVKMTLDDKWGYPARPLREQWA